MNITIAGVTYNDVPQVDIPKAAGSGNATFFELGELIFKGASGTYTVTATAEKNAAYDIPPVENLILENARSIWQYAGANNPIVKSLVADVTNVGAYSLAYCSALTTVEVPNATSIGNRAFYNCEKLKTLNIAAFTGVNSTNTLLAAYCTELENVTATALQAVAQGMFEGCTKLATITLPAATEIRTRAFYGTGLTDLYLPGSTVATLASTNAFSSTPIASGTGTIHVPAALETAYKSAANWTTYASQIVGDL